MEVKQQHILASVWGSPQFNRVTLGQSYLAGPMRNVRGEGICILTVCQDLSPTGTFRGARSRNMHTSKNGLYHHGHKVLGVIRITVKSLNLQYDLYSGFTVSKYLHFWGKNFASKRRNDHQGDHPVVPVTLLTPQSWADLNHWPL